MERISNGNITRLSDADLKKAVKSMERYNSKTRQYLLREMRLRRIANSTDNNGNNVNIVETTGGKRKTKKSRKNRKSKTIRKSRKNRKSRRNKRSRKN